MTIKAVIFDLDDTLYPERAYAIGGFEAVAAKFSDLLGDENATVAEMIELMEEGFRGRIFNELLARRGIETQEQVIMQMVDAYRTHRPRIEFHADADTALRRLKPNYRLGIITDGAAIQQWAKIDALDLRGRVEEIVVTSEIVPENLTHTTELPPHSFAKPHPLAFELVAKRFDLSPPECVYVADNPSKDFVAPNALGWLTVQVMREDGIYLGVEVAEGGEPDSRIDTLDDLDALLTKH